jgi:hypothetical protein
LIYFDGPLEKPCLDEFGELSRMVAKRSVMYVYVAKLLAVPEEFPEADKVLLVSNLRPKVVDFSTFW